MSNDRIYLDHCATTPILPAAREAMIASLDIKGNASSVHSDGRRARATIESARRDVAGLAGANAKQVVFTGSASEAITQAIVGGANALNVDLVVTSAGEHKAVLAAAEMAGVPCKQFGLLANGEFDFDQLKSILDVADENDANILVAAHHVNNETGVIQNVARLGAMVGASPHFLFVDAVQAFGKVDLDFASSAADMMAVSGHKIGGPQGIGALLVKAHCDNVKLVPGGGQEVGRRGGTEALNLISGFGAAAKTISTALNLEKCTDLTGFFERSLREIFPDVIIFGEEAKRTGIVSNFALPGFAHNVSLMQLDLSGISISSGSACASGKVSRSHVLDAMKVDEALSECALRMSVGWNTERADVEQLLLALEKILNKQGAASPSVASAIA